MSGSTLKTIGALVATGLIGVGVAGCGAADVSGDGQNSSATTSGQGSRASISLAGANVRTDNVRTKTGLIGVNVINLAAEWPDWSGRPSGITYDAASNQLQIPPPSDGADMALGVQRYDQALSGRYELKVESVDGQVAALIFLFDEAGQVLPIAGEAGPLYVARPNAALQFDAPAGTAGYFIQVQNGWRATTVATVSPSFSFQGGALGDNLINPRGPWLGWAGEAVGLSYNALIGRVAIAGAPAGVGNTFGVQRLGAALTPGREYELSVDFATKPGASLLLFLIDANGGTVPFDDLLSGQTLPWIAVTAQESAPAFNDVRRFTLPDGVAEVVVQVQGPWNEPDMTWVEPRLVLVDR